MIGDTELCEIATRACIHDHERLSRHLQHAEQHKNRLTHSDYDETFTLYQHESHRFTVTVPRYGVVELDDIEPASGASAAKYRAALSMLRDASNTIPRLVTAFQDVRARFQDVHERRIFCHEYIDHLKAENTRLKDRVEVLEGELKRVGGDGGA